MTDKSLVERLHSALAKLEKAATAVHRRGAVTGPQWSDLTGALITARAALNEGTAPSDPSERNA